MGHLFSPVGMLCLQRLAAVPSVLVFDLDGTLAPIVTHFSQAAVPAGTARRLTRLTQFWPVVVVTGRSVADARRILGFTPDYLFGNHGAERADQNDQIKEMAKAGQAVTTQRLNNYRQLAGQFANALEARNVNFEDKGLSLALHYRQSNSPVSTRAWLHELISSVGARAEGPEALVTDGHMVINILLPHAPDKGDALLTTMQECGAQTALVVGDDANDEPAFVKAPSHAVTVRINAAHAPTSARFSLSGQFEVDTLLEHLLSCATRWG